MRLVIEHSTAWHDEAATGSATRLLRLTPRDTARQHVVVWDLALPCAATRGTDAYGNVQHVLTLDCPQKDVALTARGVVEIDPDADEDDDGLNPLLFLRSTGHTQADAAIAMLSDDFRADDLGAGELTLPVVRALMVTIESAVKREAGAFAGRTAAEALARRAGTCHDQVHVFLSCLRLLGVPARYVSGYVHGIDGNRVSSHGWAEAFVQGRWHTWDIANRLDRPTSHLKLAIGMDYLDACPVRGVRFGLAREQLSAAALIAQAQQANQ